MRTRGSDPQSRIYGALCVFIAAALLTAASAASARAPVAADTEGKLSKPELFIAPTGSDVGPCSKSVPCSSWDRAYQIAKPGQTIQVADGTYANQVIRSKSGTRNLRPGCTPAVRKNCVLFRPAPGATVQINGVLEIHGSGVYVQGTRSQTGLIPSRGASYNIRVSGYVDTEATSTSDFPDHVVVEGVDSTSFGVFGTDTVTFRWMDVGPGTITSGCRIKEGPGLENKIGFSGQAPVVPKNVTLDGLLIHNQNGDIGREASGCHFGGLFLVTVDGLTIRNSVFSQNVVYNIQVQNFVGTPATNVTIENNWFGCAVDWAYRSNACQQQAIQFSRASYSNWLIRYNSLVASIWSSDGATFSDFAVVGNAGDRPSGCYPGMSFRYNAWVRSTCASSDKSLVALPFLNSTPGSDDLHLVPRSAATTLVPPISPDLQLRLDMEGRFRPVRVRRDAGALERDTALLVLGRTIGSAAIGMSRAEILQRYGQPRRSRGLRLGTARVPGRVESFSVPNGTISVTSVAGRVVGLATSSPYYTTARGVGPGARRVDAGHLAGVAWVSCERAFHRDGPVAISLRTNKSKVTSVVMIRRAYARACA